MSEVEVRKQFTVNLSDTPVWITDDLVFLGEIPRQFAFERADPGMWRILHPDGTRAPDQLPDDTALAFRSDKGLVIIRGCSHAGICNITEYARAACRERRVAGILGGLHLPSPTPEQLKKAGGYLQDLHLNALHACHCISHASKIALAEYCPVQETCVGIIHVWQRSKNRIRKKNPRHFCSAVPVSDRQLLSPGKMLIYHGQKGSLSWRPGYPAPVQGIC